MKQFFIIKMMWVPMLAAMLTPPFSLVSSKCQLYYKVV